jgi:methylated-DNA-[protein]-cysteine S-methyltransferase
VRQSLPRGCEYRMIGEASEYALSVVRLLARLEAGEEETPSFELCPDCIGEPLASVARVTSAVPRGYVATYGGIAAAAGTEARVVGHIMATNPLYPIIPCHRVVGADLSLIGYTGSRDTSALRMKLNRLRAEARGFTEVRTVPTPLGSAGLAVYPVERVIAKATCDGLDPGPQLSLW